MQDNAQESMAAAAVKLSPPTTVIVASVAGMSLQDWVFTLTIIYTVLLLIHHIVWKWILPLRDRRKFAAKLGLKPEASE
ncbi:MAG TPA: hypothetical protein VEY92_08485 [Pseudoxanthomonas sp.]|nr:hypothetical protein [Pseudoxanthomonas sp.]